MVPKCMSTQHPDNVSSPHYAVDGVLKGEGEITEAMEVFSLGCDEQMWDSEGKESDNQVVQKLLTGHPEFFKDQHELGKSCAITLRVPNPNIEWEMRKSLVEALQGIPTAWDVAKEFYQNGFEAPIQEVILPFTTSAEELKRIEVYYRKFIVGQESETLVGGGTVSDWVGEFYPKQIRVIPLFEDLDQMVSCDSILEEFLSEYEVPYQRVFLARSDPALNYGLVSAELMLKMALRRLYDLEGRLGIPFYPIIGVGAAPFRGHLNPTNVNRTFNEYPSAQTLTVQSAFKYDYDRSVVAEGVQQILAHERTEPSTIDEDRAYKIIQKYAAEYQNRIKKLSPVITKLAEYVPKRRERKLHIGLFGYGRTLKGADDTTLPRAIGFCASLYSIGVPPELLGLSSLSSDDLSFIRQTYPNFDYDLAAALRYTNEDRVRELLGEEYVKLAGQYAQGVDRVHEGLTGAVWAGLEQGVTSNIGRYVEEAAHLRHFLG